jgi:hypothetical protein
MGSLRATSLEAFDEIDRVFNPLPQFFSLGEEVSTTMKAFQNLVPLPKPNKFQSLSFAPSARLYFGLVFTLKWFFVSVAWCENLMRAVFRPGASQRWTFRHVPYKQRVWMRMHRALGNPATIKACAVQGRGTVKRKDGLARTFEGRIKDFGAGYSAP